MEQNVDIPVPRGRHGEGGLQGLRPGQNSVASSSHSPGAADEVFTKVFFRTFRHMKKVRGWVRTRGRNMKKVRTLLLACPWCPSQCWEEYLVTRMDEYGRWWYRWEVHPGRWYLLDTSDGVVWWDELGWFSAELESFFVRQSTAASGKISAFLAHAVRTWKFGASLPSGFVSGSHSSVCGCCLWNTEN